MGFLKDILRGVFIGVANIIPGVSGGTIALSMGVYEKIIFAINNFKKDFKGSVKTLLPYVIGAILGILCLAFIIKYLLENFKMPTVFAFIGLIIGGLPNLFKRVKGEKIKITHIISFIALALLIIVPTIVTASAVDTVKVVEFNIINVIIMFALGIISAASMVVPGVSGSMMLMMLGYYETILSNVTLCIKSMVHLEITTALGTFAVLIPFGLGVLAGIFIAAKIIEKLLTKYPIATMWGIIALVVTSPFAILYGTNFVVNNIALTIISSIITFVIGAIVAMKFSKAE